MEESILNLINNYKIILIVFLLLISAFFMKKKNITLEFKKILNENKWFSIYLKISNEKKDI
ncbi:MULTISPECIES: hypothetical protein [unclassified Clostridium]|uniref:hypothetical protein n=1 Tax=unclassified Clostridium TaxID=2614128 RepID=UPI0025B9E41F|nr:MULTISPECIES: hypothetical protein [unclassified Clostridium]